MAGGSNDTLRERISRLEEMLGASSVEGAGSLWTLVEKNQTAVAQIQSNLETFVTEAESQFAKVMEDVAALTDVVKTNVADLEGELTILKRAVSGQTVHGDGVSKIKIPEPKSFVGARSAKDLENFLWDMEQYFKAAHVPDAEKVTITSMYLAGDAKLWWRTRVEDDVSAGRPKIDTWAALKKELKDQFLPCNAAWIARESLRKLKHTGTVRDYVKEFSSLMLDIKNMSEEDKLFNFMSGLQTWAQAELRRQNVRDLPTAIAAADGLVDFRPSSGPTEEGRTNDGKRKDKAGTSKEGAKNKAVVTAKPSEGEQPSRPFTGCFLCSGPHRVKDCPKREKLSALVAAQEEQYEPESPRVNTLQLLNAISVQPDRTSGGGKQKAVVQSGSGKKQPTDWATLAEESDSAEEELSKGQPVRSLKALQVEGPSEVTKSYQQVLVGNGRDRGAVGALSAKQAGGLRSAK